MTAAPGQVDAKQFGELGISIVNPEDRRRLPTHPGRKPLF